MVKWSVLSMMSKSYKISGFDKDTKVKQESQHPQNTFLFEPLERKVVATASNEASVCFCPFGVCFLLQSRPRFLYFWTCCLSILQPSFNEVRYPYHSSSILWSENGSEFLGKLWTHSKKMYSSYLILGTEKHTENCLLTATKNVIKVYFTNHQFTLICVKIKDCSTYCKKKNLEVPIFMIFFSFWQWIPKIFHSTICFGVWYNKCVFLHMHLAVGYLRCSLPPPLFTSNRARVVTWVWFWSSFLVDCLSCQAPLHSINDTTFNGVEIKIDQIKNEQRISRCKHCQKMKFDTGFESQKVKLNLKLTQLPRLVIVNFFEWRIILGFFARREGKILMIPHISNAGNFLLPIILQITKFLYYSKWNILSHECMSFSAKIRILNFEFFTSIFVSQLFGIYSIVRILLSV